MAITKYGVKSSSLFDPTEGGDNDLENTNTSNPNSGVGSILSGRASILRAQTEAAKLQAEATAAAAAIARQQSGAKAQEDYLRQQLTLGIPKTISGDIDAQETSGRQYITDQAALLLGQLNTRKAQGEGATTTGFSNLLNYLAKNQPTAFAQAQRAQPQVAQSGLTQYMAGQGVSPAVAQEAANIGNVQAAGGAANFNSLLNVLAGAEASGQQSRQSEAEMGRTSALANLQAIYGQGTSGLEQQRLSALQELATTISNARLQAQREAEARNNSIRDALAALYGTGYVTPPPGECPPGQEKDANGNCVPKVTANPANVTLDGISAGTTPNPGVSALLELIAQAQQSPTYNSGAGEFITLPNMGERMMAL